MRAEESGQVMVLTIGMMLVVLAVGGLAIDGTRALLLRRSLQHSVDGASTAAAAEINKSAYYKSGGTIVVLRPERARRVASLVLSRRGLQAIRYVDADEHSVSVRMVTEMETALLKIVGISRITVGAEARARAFPQVVPLAE